MWTYFKIITWGCVWFWVWAFTIPIRRNRHNCLTWALKRFNSSEKGYLTIRWSSPNKFGMRWPHFGFLHQEYSKYIDHYVPKLKYNKFSQENEVLNLETQKIAPDIWFDGEPQRGDEGFGEN